MPSLSCNNKYWKNVLQTSINILFYLKNLTIFQIEKFAYIQSFLLQSSTLNNPNTNTNKLSNYNVASLNMRRAPDYSLMRSIIISVYIHLMLWYIIQETLMGILNASMTYFSVYLINESHQIHQQNDTSVMQMLKNI